MNSFSRLASDIRRKKVFSGLRNAPPDAVSFKNFYKYYEKFKGDPAFNPVLNFGNKYRGQRMRDVPQSYIDFIIKKTGPYIYDPNAPVSSLTDFLDSISKR